MTDKERAKRFDEWLDGQDIDTIMTVNRHVKKLAKRRNIGPDSAKSLYAQLIMVAQECGFRYDLIKNIPLGKIEKELL